MLCCPNFTTNLPLLLLPLPLLLLLNYSTTTLLKILQLSVKHMIASTLMQRQDKTRNAAAQTMASPSYPPLIMVFFGCLF